MKRIPPEQLEAFARSEGLTQAILVGWCPDGTTHVVTWGESLVDSAQAAQGGNFVKKALGYPECDCMALSPRVRDALERETDQPIAKQPRHRAEQTHEAVHRPGQRTPPEESARCRSHRKGAPS